MSTRAPDPVWVGIDVGGTGTRVCVAAPDGRELAGTTVATGSLREDPLGLLVATVRSCLPAAALPAGIGIGASGPVDLTTGRLHNPDTLPELDGLDVAGSLAASLGAPTWIDSDAVVAALAELTWGGHGDSGSLVCVTLGTGIGVGIVVDGRPWRAADGSHPEAGHLPVSAMGSPAVPACYCGLASCWEQAASRTALDRLRGPDGTVTPIGWRQYAAQLAEGLVALTTLYRPAVVVIGGGVAVEWERLEPPLHHALAGYREFRPGPVLRPSRLGPRAGARGATLLPRLQIGWSSTPSDR